MARSGPFFVRDSAPGFYNSLGKVYGKAIEEIITKLHCVGEYPIPKATFTMIATSVSTNGKPCGVHVVMSMRTLIQGLGP